LYLFFYEGQQFTYFIKKIFEEVVFVQLSGPPHEKRIKNGIIYLFTDNRPLNLIIRFRIVLVTITEMCPCQMPAIKKWFSFKNFQESLHHPIRI
jgi:hypothetical protein